MTQNVLKYLIILSIGFLVAYVLTPLVMRLARCVGMLDRPDERRIHKGIIPRGGGLAVFAGFHLACAAIYFLPWFPFDISLTLDWWLKFFPASLFLIIVGVADDRWGMQPRIKLGCQILAALALYASGIHLGALFQQPLPWFVDCALTVFWCVGFMNAFNLIDGLDGLATGLGIIAATGVAGSLLLRRLPGDSLVLLGLIGACLGFLRYNFNPARVFLGDTGSMFIGFTLAAISLSTGSKGTVLASMAIPLLAAGVPILDTTLAIWRRSVRRLRQNMEGNTNGNGKVFTADKDHLHHRLLRSGHSHRKVATILYLLNAAMVAVGLLSLAFHSLALAIYLLAFVAAAYVIVRHLAHVELWDSGMAVLNGLRRPPRKALAVMFYPLADLLILAVALLASTYLTYQYPQSLKEQWLHQSVFLIAVPFLFIVCSRTYSRVWSRARPSEYIMLGVAFSASIMVAIALSAAVVTPLSRRIATHDAVFWAASLLGLMGLRLLPRIIQDMLPTILRYKSIEGIERIPCLVYGAGYGCTLFLRAQNQDADKKTTHQVVVALLDDDTNLHGRTIYGHKVIGGIEKLEAAVARYHVQQIVITTHLDDGIFQRVTDFASANHINVFKWRTDLRSQQFTDLHFSMDRNLREMTSRLLRATPRTMDDDIRHCLSISARFAKATVCCAVLFKPGTCCSGDTYLWTAQDVPRPVSTPLHSKANAYRYLAHQLTGSRVAFIPSARELPLSASSEIAFLENMGVTSAMVLPLGREYDLIGFVLFGGISFPKIKDRDMVPLLALQVEILSLAFLAART
jgi:UDP-N-acetylmuramyl pentapeptide phosphotransferase/UDP-N-acetylglucosamine-1-phosphate transferase